MLTNVQSSDGTAICSHVVGEGPPLVLVHGTSADHTRWAPVLPALGASFTTYAVDRRGRGASGDHTDYSIDREIDDVRAVIDATGAQVDVIAHSYGAVCALEAALRISNIRRLVLYEPPLPVGMPIHPPGLVRRLEEMLDTGDRQGVLTAFVSEVVRMPPEEVEALQRDPSWGARIAAADTIPRELRSMEVFRADFDRFADVRIPTLLLVGGDSPPFLIEPSRRLQKVIPGSRLVVLDGQQHMAMNTAPELFLEHVLTFLS
jgi:pimeloyl-ACP methyl ester carboxylesterase